LRDRRTDIPFLADHFLEKTLAQMDRADIVLSEEVMTVMMGYDWPGNVRELENAIKYSLVKCRGDVVHVEHLPPTISGDGAAWRAPLREFSRRRLDVSAVQRALTECKGNKAAAARALGVGRATLYRFLGQHGVR